MIDWQLVFSGLGFVLAVYAIAAARHRATIREMDHLKGELTGFKEAYAASAGRFGERLQAVEAKAENVKDHGERLTTVETLAANAIGHADLDALARRHHDDLALVHRRVDEVQNAFTQIFRELGKIEGILSSRLPLRRETDYQ